MKLQVGKKYKDRNGDCWEVVEDDGEHLFPFSAVRLKNNYQGWFHSNGKYTDDGKHNWDLVEEVPAPQRTTGLNLVEAYRAVKTGEWEFKRPGWPDWQRIGWFADPLEGVEGGCVASDIELDLFEFDDFELRPFKKPLVLEAGKYYRTRDGHKAYVGWVAPEEVRELFSVKGYVIGEEGTQTWKTCGTYHGGSKHAHDLVALWEDEQ